MNVGTEATSADRTHTRRRPQNLDLRQRLGRPQHQHLRFGLGRDTLIQHGIELFDGRAHHIGLNLLQHCFTTAPRKDFLTSDDDALHPQACFELGLPARLLLRQLIVMLHQRLEITPQWLARIMHFLELIQPQQTGQLVSVNPVALVPVPGDPGVGLRMRTHHAGH